MDYVSELRKRIEKGVSDNNEFNKNDSDFVKYLRSKTERATNKIYEIDDEYINSFLKDSNAFLNNASSEYEKMTFGQSSNIFSSQNDSAKEL